MVLPCKKTRTIVIPKGTVQNNEAVVIEISPKVKSCNNLLIAKFDEKSKKIYADVLATKDFKTFGSAMVLEGSHPDVSAAINNATAENECPPQQQQQHQQIQQQQQQQHQQMSSSPSRPFASTPSAFYNIPSTVQAAYSPRFNPLPQSFPSYPSSTSAGGFTIPNISSMPSSFMPEQQSRYGAQQSYMPSSFTPGYPQQLARAAADPNNLRRYFNDSLASRISPGTTSTTIDNSNSILGQYGSRSNLSVPFRTTTRSRSPKELKCPACNLRRTGNYQSPYTERSDDLDHDVNKFLSSLNDPSHTNKLCKCKGKQEDKEWLYESDY